MLKFSNLTGRLYLLVPIFIFVFLYFYLSTPIYTSANLHVGLSDGGRLFIDIGKGFNERISVPVQGGVATISNRFVSIQNIKSLAVGNNLRELKVFPWTADNFRKYTNNYLMYQLALALFITFLAVSKSVKVFVANALTNFDRQELLFFVLSASLYSAACIIMFPFLSYDSFVPFSAVYGQPWDVFTGGFKVLYTLSYVCFGNPMIFLHILAVLAMSLLISSFFAALKVALNVPCAIIGTFVVLLMPFLYVEVIVVERPFSSVLAVSGFMLCFSSNICRRKIGDWRNCFALIFLYLAMLMRQDLVLYFFAAVFFLFIRDFRPTKAVILSLLLTCVVFASSNAVDFIVSTNPKEVATRRFADSLSSVFGYIIKENKFSPDESKDLESLFPDIAKCKAEWKVGAYNTNIKPCLTNNPKIFSSIFYPIVLRTVTDNPFGYLKSRYEFFKYLYNEVRLLRNYRGNVASNIYEDYITSGVQYEAQKASLFSSLKSNQFQSDVISFLTWNKLNIVIFAMLLFLSSIVFVKRHKKLNFLCFYCLAIALAAPCGKVLSTVLFAPQAVFVYMIDSLIFVMLILPVLLVSITKVDKKGEYKNSHNDSLPML